MNNLSKTSLSDLPFNETRNDFGTERYVDGLIRFIENSSTPITIALQGEWGSGKTSLMSRLEGPLCKSENAPFIGVNINTWEYSMMSTPELTVYQILARLIQELTKDDPKAKKTFKNFIRGAKNIAYRGLREGGKNLPGLTGTAIAILMEMAGVPTELQNKDDVDNAIATLSELKADLQEAVRNQIAKNNKRGVIVFVDDLDRLNPPVAVEILELLKNVFTLEHCIFVLAIDYDVVVKGLEPKFGKLTDKNEREFRSFFDKIIQVPFSLPVNSYQPMKFVLESLVKIGYLEDLETSIPSVKSRFSAVVDASVGKNPRSIKRLINTLSLLDCIDQSDKKEKGAAQISIDDKLLNFIIVAIQICYPQVYRLLVHKPAFTEWNSEFACKEGLAVSAMNHEDMRWPDILDAACASDKYLTQHLSDILSLFTMIVEILEKTNEDSPDAIGLKLGQILDKSSVTGVNTGLRPEDFNKKDFIYKLHANVEKRLNALRPDISTYKLKNNTGNGGLRIWIDDEHSFEVIFSPAIDSRYKIALTLRLDLRLARPEEMKGLSFDEMMKDERLSSALKAIDSVLTPMLANDWFFAGKVHNGLPNYIPSFLDELRYKHERGWLSEDVTDNPEYRIILDKPSQFEDSLIVDAITNVLIANFIYRRIMNGWE